MSQETPPKHSLILVGGKNVCILSHFGALQEDTVQSKLGCDLLHKWFLVSFGGLNYLRPPIAIMLSRCVPSAVILSLLGLFKNNMRKYVKGAKAKNLRPKMLGTKFWLNFG